jgi:hypothetical protein
LPVSGSIAGQYVPPLTVLGAPFCQSKVSAARGDGDALGTAVGVEAAADAAVAADGAVLVADVPAGVEALEPPQAVTARAITAREARARAGPGRRLNAFVGIRCSSCRSATAV